MFSATILKEGTFQAEAAELKAVARPLVLDKVKRMRAAEWCVNPIGNTQA